MISPTVEDLRIQAFTHGVGRWVRAQVRDAQQRHLSGIVLDLRDDPGGLLDEAVETASAFLSGGPVVSYQQRGSRSKVLDALGRGNTRIPLVVLVDGGTASAAEIVAGAMQDRGRAVIVGSTTFGKGSVQAPSQLSDGSAIELSVRPVPRRRRYHAGRSRVAGYGGLRLLLPRARGAVRDHG
jgi:carboxyl-terminal processing protease